MKWVQVCEEFPGPLKSKEEKFIVGFSCIAITGRKKEKKNRWLILFLRSFVPVLASSRHNWAMPFFISGPGVLAMPPKTEREEEFCCCRWHVASVASSGWVPFAHFPVPVFDNSWSGRDVCNAPHVAACCDVRANLRCLRENFYAQRSFYQFYSLVGDPKMKLVYSSIFLYSCSKIFIWKYEVLNHCTFHLHAFRDS